MFEECLHTCMMGLGSWKLPKKVHPGGGGITTIYNCNTSIAASYHPCDIAMATIHKRWQSRHASPVVDTGKTLRTACWLHEECHLFQKLLKNSPLLLNLKETGCVSAVLSC